jgi:hypothetical protein
MFLAAVLAVTMAAATPASAHHDGPVYHELWAPCEVRSGCGILFEGATGTVAYGTQPMYVVWADGHDEVFVVGTDHRVWHMTSWLNDWRQIAGAPNVANMKDAFISGGGHSSIAVRVNSGNTWCAAWHSSRWNWWDC